MLFSYSDFIFFGFNKSSIDFFNPSCGFSFELFTIKKYCGNILTPFPGLQQVASLPNYVESMAPEFLLVTPASCVFLSDGTSVPSSLKKDLVHFPELPFHSSCGFRCLCASGGWAEENAEIDTSAFLAFLH
jgi:hypothetical protein